MADQQSPPGRGRGFFEALFPVRPAARTRLKRQVAPAVTYAIGDVHGCLDLLRQLEAKIVADAEEFEGGRLIVMLGDYVDRGPQSAQVIDHLLSPPPAGFERVCICGNHDVAMLAFLEGKGRSEEWLDFGAEATLASYGLDINGLGPRERSPALLARRMAALVPEEHLTFLQRAPVLLETPSHIFVHAGLRPGRSLEAQADEDLLWIRHIPAARLAEFGKPVVHGHTPVDVAFADGPEIAIDTAAFATGRLTAVRLMANKPPIFLETDATRRQWTGP